MIPAPALDEIDLMLNEKAPWGVSGPLTRIGEKIRVLGFIFVPPDAADSNVANLLYNINLLHKDSGNNFHFILVGVSQFSGERAVGKIDDVNIYYNSGNFSEFRESMEKKLEGWRYDYSLEIVFIDIVGEAPNRSLNFDSAIYFKIDEIVKSGICDNASQFLGKIIKLSRDSKFMSVKDILRFFQSQFGVNWIKALILSAFPRSIQKLARVSAVLGGGRAVDSID